MKTVLIVEDNLDVSAMLQLILELSGKLNVRVWNEEFDSICDAQHWEGIDIAIVDIMLPGMDGRVICRWLAEHQPHIRRVVYSAMPDEQLTPEQCNAHAILPKMSDYRRIAEALEIE